MNVFSWFWVHPKKMTLLFATLFCLHFGIAQTSPDFIATNKKGMQILGGWSAINVVGNSALLLTNPSEKQIGFYSSNIAWNAVNGILAFGGLRTLNRGKFKPNYEQKLKRTFAVNTFIDVGYIAAGSALALHKNSSERMVGIGESIVLQGAFLLVFDAIMWRSNAKITPVIQSNSMGIRILF